MRIALLLIFTVSIVSTAFAQHQPTEDEVRNSGNYLWGIGRGESYRQADKNALDHMISQITVQVESYFEGKTTEREGDITEFAELVVKTYSNVTVESAKSMLLEEKRGNYAVLRYISLNDLDRLFENRERKIKAYVRSGLAAEKDLRIGDALKNYYWAMVLLQSHKDRNRIMFDFPESGEQLLSSALPEIINNVFADLDFVVQFIDDRPDEKYKAVHMKITYNGEPVDNLDYYTWRGTGYSNLISVRSGIGIAEFFGENTKKVEAVKLLVEYQYEHKTTFDLEVDAVFKNINIPYMNRCEFVVPLPKRIVDEAEPVKLETDDLEYAEINEVEKPRRIRKTVSTVVEAVETGNADAVFEYFTPDGLNMYNALIAGGNVKVLPLVDTLKLVELETETMVRSVPMKFSYRNNSREFVEQVVFTFNDEQKIDAVSFAISDKAISDIVSRSSRFGSTQDKYQLISFLEHYKTAYCLKRLDHIESIFADNALIIVGHVVKAAEPIDGMYAMAGNDKVEFIELSKTEYLERLRKVFKSNEFVNIHFEDNIVKKVNGDSKIYGIQIKQDYYSATYADKGYLFLMIDLNDSLNPKIYVRTWQPERNPDGSIFGLDDFFVN
jgi:hypothetical protein